MVPPTVHTGVVSETKLTGKPDEAVAATVMGPLPNGWFANDPKAMVWAERATTMVNPCVASGAMLFVAVNEPTKIPAVLGVPSMTPNTLSSVRPRGSAPVATENVGAGVPVAIIAKL